MEKSGLIRRINDIYVRLGDDISKKLFLNRMLYLITGDSAYMIKEIRKLPEGRYFYDLMETIQDRYLFGCGDLGKRMAKVWGDGKGLSIIMIVDKGILLKIYEFIELMKLVMAPMFLFQHACTIRK